MDNNSIYQFTVEKLNGEHIGLADYRDKVLMIVNIASQCGFTPQMNDLAELKKEFAGEEFDILAFPSNDFGGQEPLQGEEIAAFCHNYGSDLTIFEKSRLRGEFAIPLYKYLAKTSKPRWNFHKYLIDRNGKVVDFFYPFTKPTSSKIKKKIQRLLAAVPQ